MGLEEIRGRVETIQTTALLKSARMLSNLSERPSASADMKDFQETNDNDNIGTLSAVMKGFIQGLEDMEIWGREELRSAKIPRSVLETWRD